MRRPPGGCPSIGYPWHNPELGPVPDAGADIGHLLPTMAQVSHPQIRPGGRGLGLQDVASGSAKQGHFPI